MSLFATSWATTGAFGLFKFELGALVCINIHLGEN
jgi:hypothetical protein